MIGTSFNDADIFGSSVIAWGKDEIFFGFRKVEKAERLVNSQLNHFHRYA